MTDIKTLTKLGHPAEEILNMVKEQAVDMIAAGSRGKRLRHLILTTNK